MKEIDKLCWGCHDRLAAAIVEQAVLDWRLLIKRKVKKKIDKRQVASFQELRRFFNSSYCEFLMSGMTIKPSDILRQLEKEKEEAGL